MLFLTNFSAPLLLRPCLIFPYSLFHPFWNFNQIGDYMKLSLWEERRKVVSQCMDCVEFSQEKLIDREIDLQLVIH